MTLKADLESEVKKIFTSSWKERDGRVVPGPKDLSLENDAVKLQATVLYADMADSTDLVEHHRRPFAAEIYRAYLRCTARIIKNRQGSITAYDGDRCHTESCVMVGSKQEGMEARCAYLV